jgi:exonuclease SbcC
MFKKIVIKNFQSHKRTVLRLSKGINGIIGLPNSGKTAIIRAILLAKNNRPRGFAYHNNFIDSPITEVHIKPDNEPLIKFIKTKSKTKFYYGNKSFKTGTNVPDKIAEGLNLRDINFGLQLGLPFLILSSPSEIARQINKVTESEVVNKCIKETNDRLNKLKSKRKSLKINIDDYKSKLTAFKNLDRVKPLIDKGFEYDKKIEGTYLKIDELEHIKLFITKAQNAIVNQKKPLQALDLINDAESIQKEMEKLASQMIILENIKRLKISLKSAIKEKIKIIDDYTNELKRSKLCPTCYEPIKLRTIKNIKMELDR